MQQQPRRWPGFDKCVETKLRWDVYIRPWPPGWSFRRRIYTSRGSERVKPQFFARKPIGKIQEKNIHARSNTANIAIILTVNCCLFRGGGGGWRETKFDSELLKGMGKGRDSGVERRQGMRGLLSCDFPFCPKVSLFIPFLLSVPFTFPLTLFLKLLSSQTTLCCVCRWWTQHLTPMTSPMANSWSRWGRFTKLTARVWRKISLCTVTRRARTGRVCTLSWQSRCVIRQV